LSQNSSPNGELWAPKGEVVVAPNGLLPNVEADWPKAEVDPKLKDGELEAPKAGVLAAPNAVVEAPNAGVVEAPKAGVLEAPKAGVLEAPNAGVLEEPNMGLLEAPNAPPDPNTGALDTPNAVPVLPNAGVVVEPKAGVLVAPKAGFVAPNAGVLVAPNAGVLVAPNAGVLVDPKAGVLAAPNADWLVAPKGVEEPNMLFPNAGCDCWFVLPKGLVWAGVEPKPPKGFWPKTDDPIEREESYQFKQKLKRKKKTSWVDKNYFVDKISTYLTDYIISYSITWPI
jgi:hypothetical protein